MTATASKVAQPKSIPTKIAQDIEFYDHQIEGIRVLARLTNFLLADEMGLGKTIQSMTVAALDFDNEWANRILVLTPAPIKFNWDEDLELHTLFDVVVLDGNPVKRAKILDEFDADVLIVNYELLHKHLDQFNAMNFDIVICDEAHLLKNPKAVKTKAVHKLKAKRFFMLTGSPVLNRADELWSILHRIDPETFPSYWKFINRYCLFGGFNRRQIVGVKKPEELKKIVDTVMLRRLKKDCLDLPEKQYIKVYVELNPRQREIYDKLKKEMMLELPHDPDPMQLESGMQVFGRLSQVASTPATVGLEDDSAKLDAVVLYIQNLYREGEKSIVFCKNRATLECLRLRLEAVGIIMPQMHGGVSKKRRQETINEWTAAEEPLPFGMMLQVGGVGLNLTAARHVLFVDRLFVPKLNEQAEDRAHRIGTSVAHPVQIVSFLARRTIDQRVDNILAAKEELFDSIVNPNDWKKELYRSLMEEDEDE